MHSANKGSSFSKNASEPPNTRSDITPLYNSQPGSRPPRPTTIDEIPSRIGATGLRSRRFFHSPNRLASKKTGVKKIAKVRINSTRYLTSRKKRLAADRKIAIPAARITRNATRTGSQSRFRLDDTPSATRMIARTQQEIKKSMN